MIEGSTSFDNPSVILVDDLSIDREYDCPASELTCSFEYGLCSYSSSSVYDSPWLVGRGVTERPELVSGPALDATMGSGMYAYVDFTSKAINCE